VSARAHTRTHKCTNKNTQVGEFVVQDSDPSFRMQWQACKLGPGCYVTADSAPLTTRKTRRPKENHHKPRLLADNSGTVSSQASSRSKRFGQHDLYRVQCSNFVTMFPHLTYKFGYKTADETVLFSPSDVSFVNLYLPSGSVKVVISISDALGANMQYLTPSVTVDPVALQVTTIISHVDSLLQLGSYGLFYNYLDVVFAALGADQRRASSGSMQTSRAATSLRQIDSDAVLLDSNNIMAMATAFSKDAPTVDNALVTVSSLAKLLSGAESVSAEARIASARLLLDATNILSLSSDSIAANDAASLLNNVMICVAKVLGWLRPMDTAIERTVMPQMLAPISTAVLRLMRTEMLGQTHQACSSAVCTSALVSTYSVTLDASTLVDTPFPASGPQESMKVLFSPSTIRDVAVLTPNWMLDLHLTLWKFTWGQQAAETAIVSDIHSLAVSQTTRPLALSLSAAGRLRVTIPLVPAHVQQAMSASRFSLSDVPNRAPPSWSLDVRALLKVYDVNGDGTLDPAESVNAFDVLLTHFYHWECMEWEPVQLTWVTDGCTALESRSGSVTCACSTAGTFAVVIDTSKTVCGDGRVTGKEECDDGNVVGGDGCSQICQIETDAGFFCTAGNTVSKSKCGYGREDCPARMLGPSCEFMCSRPVPAVARVCMGSRFLPSSITIQTVDGLKGAVINAKSGMSLTVKPGSFSGAKEITISVYDEIALEELGATMVQSGPVVRFGPEGLHFTFNATLALHFKPNASELSNASVQANPMYQYIVHYLNPKTGQWEAIGGDASKEEGLVRAGVAHFSTYVVMRIPARVAQPTREPGSSGLKVTSIVVIAFAGAGIIMGLCFGYKRLYARKADSIEDKQMPLQIPKVDPQTRSSARDKARSDLALQSNEDTIEVDLITLEDQTVVVVPEATRIGREFFNRAPLEVEESFSPFHAVADFVVPTSLDAMSPRSNAISQGSNLLFGPPDTEFGGPEFVITGQMYQTQGSMLSASASTDMPILSALSRMYKIEDMATSSLYASRSSPHASSPLYASVSSLHASSRNTSEQLTDALLAQRINSMAPGFARASLLALNPTAALSQMQTADFAQAIAPSVMNAPAVLGPAIAMAALPASTDDEGESVVKTPRRKLISM
jgi:cysteine-rich repeat protein